MKTQDDCNLDFLRAMAVFFVVASHVAYFFGIVTLATLSVVLIGVFGVLIFFVHTSLVLMFSLDRQWNQRGKHGLFSTFMVRRCFRIFPLSVVVLVVIIVFHVPQAVLAPGRFEALNVTPWDIFFNLALIQNLAKRDSILTVMWSLPYEMQMYLFLPWLFLLLGQSRSILRSVFLWMLSVAAAVFSLHHLKHIPDLALYVPCFMPGVIAYQVQKRKSFKLAAFLWPPIIVALLVLYLVGANWAAPYPPPIRWAVRWAPGLLLGFAAPSFAPLSLRWLNVASHVVAKYSYGIYLTHCLAIWLAFAHLGSLPWVGKILVFIVTSVGLPVFFYHSVEEPMIRVGRRLADGILPRQQVEMATVAS
jgi:peptidoglycan/LPS O-acetylase OafA/YrhL